MAETPATTTPPATPPTANPPDYQLDYSRVSEAYANFCRVAQTPEELVLDFGLNPTLAPTSEPIKITHRLILNYYTAKRLLLALNQFIQRHEAAFGVIELDFNKRVRGRQG